MPEVVGEFVRRAIGESNHKKPAGPAAWANTCWSRIATVVGSKKGGDSPHRPTAAESGKRVARMDDLRPGRVDAWQGRAFEDLLSGLLGAVTGIWVFWDFSQSRGPGLFIGAAIAAMTGGLVLVRLVRVFREPAPRRGEREEGSLPTAQPAR